MSHPPFDRPAIHAFLDHLEAAARAIPAVAAEWEEALAAWPGDAADPSAVHRFREWFLLERKSEGLGAPPVMALAPESADEDSPWQRMFAAYLGIFRAIGEDTDGLPAFEDLWSGRQVRLDQALPGTDEGVLLYGFVVEIDGNRHAPLPGAAILAGEELADAMAGDLSRIRAEQPRARLSMRSVEETLQAVLQGSGGGEATAPLEERLEALLMGIPDWDATGLLAEVARAGVGPTLDRLAFETEVDLDAMRRLIGEVELPPVEGATGDVDAALAAFDRTRSAGASLDEAFRELEQQLGLEEGSSGGDPETEALEAAGETEGEEPFGPEDLPGIAFWLKCARWEREQDPEQPGVAEADEAQEDAWLAHLEATHEDGLEAQEVTAQDHLSWLIQSSDEGELLARRRGTRAFLWWLREQQDAAIPDWLLTDGESSDEEEQLAAVVACNRAGREAGWAPEAMATVHQREPLMVQAEGELAAVEGIPEPAARRIAVGDHLSGRWRQGRFEAQLWLPAQWLPQVAPEAAS
jgi:hypothetical protein